MILELEDFVFLFCFFILFYFVQYLPSARFLGGTLFLYFISCNIYLQLDSWAADWFLGSFISNIYPPVPNLTKDHMHYTYIQVRHPKRT